MDLRQTSPGDRYAVEGLVTGAQYSHVHLDWMDPVSLAGRNPFIVATEGDALIGALGCPPDVPGVAWIRVFAAADEHDLGRIWRILWPEARAELLNQDIRRVAALALEDWFSQILEDAGLVRTNAVIFYELELDAEQSVDRSSVESIRPIRTLDADQILELDSSAFEPLWRISGEALSAALIQASSASLIEDAGKAVGYQITTSSPFGAHLARLAVHPSRQREGLGSTLVHDAIESVRKHGLGLLSVNTQKDNSSSRRLYEKFGFEPSGRDFPVFELEL